MDRRETLKALLTTGVISASGLTLVGCNEPQAETTPPIAPPQTYGRTPEEITRDAQLMAMDSIFTEDELATIAILCDIILPATQDAGSATDAEVPAFIDFIVKDMPYHQVPLKGGLMWLDREANLRFGKPFKDIAEAQRIEIVDDIAYPDRATPTMQPGVAFFNRMRDLTLTGYYTSKMGIEALGYQGNRANIWDGVPEEVLKEQGIDYEPEWLAKCVDQSKRNEIAKWDDEGNLLT